jgi:hypothetical protein
VTPVPDAAPTITAAGPGGRRVPCRLGPAGEYPGLLCAAGTVGVRVEVVVEGPGAEALAVRLREVGYRNVGVG